MSIGREDDVGRPARVDRMINEFREAKARRAGTRNTSVIESTPDAHKESTIEPTAVSAPTPPTREPSDR